MVVCASVGVVTSSGVSVGAVQLWLPNGCSSHSPLIFGAQVQSCPVLVKQLAQRGIKCEEFDLSTIMSARLCSFPQK